MGYALASLNLPSTALWLAVLPAAASIHTPIVAPQASPAALPPIGTALERAETADEVLAAAARIVAPGPPFSQPHLAHDVHQQKRQQLAVNALLGLERRLTGSGAADERRRALADPRAAHCAACAAAPSVATPDGQDAEHDRACTRLVVSALASLAAICAADAVERVERGDGGTEVEAAEAEAEAAEALAPLRDAALELAARADALAPRMSEVDGAAALWSTRRLLGTAARGATPRLEARVAEAALPFELLPALCALPPPGGSAAHSSLLPSVAALVASGALAVRQLRAEVPFAQQRLLTADGLRVSERRHTAWLAEEGIGALAYSGKLMPPAPLGACACVEAVRDALEADTAERFDCALCNLYPAGGQAACKWHTDPEHGTKWALPTSVVTAGEPRRFAFRPLGGGGGARVVFPLFSGDVVAMRGGCQQEYEHAVLAGQGEANAGARVSLVFKRALPGADGRRGHGLQGEGRRSRAKRRDGQAQGAAAKAARPTAQPRQGKRRARR